MKSFTCNRCNSPESLKWPDEYKSGNLPVSVETNRVHECLQEIERVRVFGGIISCAFCETKLASIESVCPKCEINPGVVWLC